MKFLLSVPWAPDFHSSVLAKQPLGGCHSAPQSPPFRNLPVIFGLPEYNWLSWGSCWLYKRYSFGGFFALQTRRRRTLLGLWCNDDLSDFFSSFFFVNLWRIVRSSTTIHSVTSLCQDLIHGRSAIAGGWTPEEEPYTDELLDALKLTVLLP